MKEKGLLFYNILVAFAAFLVCFGKTCFEYGVNAGNTDGLATIIIFPLVYFIFLATALVMLHKECYSKTPYLIVAAINVIFIALLWTIFLIVDAIHQTSDYALWFPIVLTVLTVAMAALYLITALSFTHKKDDKRISSKTV